jgi:two-component system OmpR family response regulator
VVEDDTSIRNIVCDILEDEGYSVAVAGNGLEALRSLTTIEPKLILLDLLMPVMSVWTFIRELQSNDVSVPVVVMSAQVSSEEQAREIGASDCLVKPFELDELLTIVAKYARPNLN